MRTMIFASMAVVLNAGCDDDGDLLLKGQAIVQGALSGAQQVNCGEGDGWQVRFAQMHAPTTGPFRLARRHCQNLPNASNSFDAVMVSPDLSRIAVTVSGERQIAVAALRDYESFTTQEFGIPPYMGDFAQAYHARPPLLWSSDGGTLFSATQERMYPRGGWALGPVRPLITENGATRELPALRHRAGPLDALLWTDSGHALALFGARGGYYRPELANPDPTLAFVDGRQGRVLETLPVSELGSGRIGAAEIVRMADQRLRAFIATDDEWFVWTQGAALARMPNPYPDEQVATALSSDGSRLLVVRRNMRVDVMCPRAPDGCSVGPPVQGVLAALHELSSGAVVWNYTIETATPGGEYPTPALSDDGRYALIGLPPLAEDIRAWVALISNIEGREVQRFPSGEHIGFARGSRELWTHAQGLTDVYALREN